METIPGFQANFACIFIYILCNKSIIPHFTIENNNIYWRYKIVCNAGRYMKEDYYE